MYCICRRKGRSIFWKRKISKSWGAAFTAKQKKKKKEVKTRTNLYIWGLDLRTVQQLYISTHLTDNFILHCWHEDENKLPKTTSADIFWSKFVPMHCKKYKKGPFNGAPLPRSIHAKSPFSIHFNGYITENCSVWY